jgi:hypothetical protein
MSTDRKGFQMQEIATMDHHHGLPSIKDGQFTLLRNANVEVHHHIAERGKNVAVITVADNKGERFQHRFPASSRVSKHLDVMTAKDLQERMTGGMYFFIGDQMVDFRDVRRLRAFGRDHQGVHETPWLPDAHRFAFASVFGA